MRITHSSGLPLLDLKIADATPLAYYRSDRFDRCRDPHLET